MSRTPRAVRSMLLVQLCVLIVVGAAIAAHLYSDRQQEIFGGRAEILYEGRETPSATEAVRQMATQRALLDSASTLGPIAGRFGLALDDLDEHVSVESVGDSNVLRLTVGHPDPALAVAVTQAVAESYIAQVRRGESPELEMAKSLIESRIEELAGQLSDLQRRFANSQRQVVAATQSPVEDGQLLAEMQSLLGRIGGLQDRLTELELQQITDSGARILTRAYLLDEPLEPQPLGAAAAGAIAGLFVACLALLVAGRLRRAA
jgi:uncharacterized protein involved in exopolysaccharide biosynthesis